MYLPPKEVLKRFCEKENSPLNCTGLLQIIDSLSPGGNDIQTHEKMVQSLCLIIYTILSKKIEPYCLTPMVFSEYQEESKESILLLDCGGDNFWITILLKPNDNYELSYIDMVYEYDLIKIHFTDIHGIRNFIEDKNSHLIKAWRKTYEL